jgi:hypothetical protein
MPTIVKAKAEEDSDSSNGVTKTRLSTNRAQMRRRAEGSDLEMWSEHGAGILCRVATPDKITAKMLRMAVRDRSPIANNASALSPQQTIRFAQLSW